LCRENKLSKKLKAKLNHACYVLAVAVFLMLMGYLGLAPQSPWSDNFAVSAAGAFSAVWGCGALAVSIDHFVQGYKIWKRQKTET
jgi:hypothetical protein